MTTTVHPAMLCANASAHGECHAPSFRKALTTLVENGLVLQLSQDRFKDTAVALVATEKKNLVAAKKHRATAAEKENWPTCKREGYNEKTK
jgi:hypothetical protein